MTTYANFGILPKDVQEALANYEKPIEMYTSSGWIVRAWTPVDPTYISELELEL